MPPSISVWPLLTTGRNTPGIEMLARIASIQLAFFKNNFFERVEVAGDDLERNQRVGERQPVHGSNSKSCRP